MLALLTLVSTAFPCAGIVHEPGVLAESDGAEVLFEVGADSVTAMWEVTYEGDAADFGWVIPVPGEPTLVTDGDLDTFADLRIVTAPETEWLDDGGSESSGGCGGSLKGDNARAGGTDLSNDVDVLAQGFTGTYDFVVLSAPTTAALTEWMDANGWSSGLDAAAADHYVRAGHAFVLLEVAPGADTDRLPPIAITYTGQTLSFPSVMARGAMAPAQRTTVYIHADQPAVVAEGWSEDEVAILTGGLDEDPQLVFEAWLSELGAARTFGRVYTGPYGDGVLTRFDTWAPAEVHDVDATFRLGSHENGALLVRLADGGGQSALWLLPLGALLAFRRRYGA